ncbi:unnamed protein product [Pleuronectes platessa]|uniref:Uncharacterized protein n=1 Tax=Pleuronectes platessa TaxID=8262 RepID=A0A9N7TRZ8_PLEPL|nr:unnamed protein product [Pleuronectes platessa]
MSLQFFLAQETIGEEVVVVGGEEGGGGLPSFGRPEIPQLLRDKRPRRGTASASHRRRWAHGRWNMQDRLERELITGVDPRQAAGGWRKTWSRMCTSCSDSERTHSGAKRGSAAQRRLRSVLKGEFTGKWKFTHCLLTTLPMELVGELV